MALKKLSKKRVKSGLEKLIPISPEFYDTEKDEDLVADKAVLLPFNAILIISQWVAFCVLMWWYSSPANNTLNTTIQTNWDYGKADGYNCTSMMKDQYWGNTFNFETCMELAREPKISTPAAATDTVVFDADKNSWKYVPYAHSTKPAVWTDIIFASDGGAYDTTDLALADQTKFRTELAALNTCGLHFFEEPMDGPDDGTGASVWYIKKSGTAGTWSDLASAAQQTTHATVCREYEDGSESKVCKADSCERPNSATDLSPSGSASPKCSNAGDYENWNDWCSINYGPTGGEGRDLYLKPSSGDDKPSCYFNHSHPLLENIATAAGFASGDAMVTAMSAQEPNSESSAVQQARQILNDYDRTKTFTACVITEAEALKMFKLFYDKTYHCQYAKNSAPFGCEASTPLPISQCFSLAYANSLLLYTVFSAICVKIFFAAKKEPADEIEIGGMMMEKPASPQMFPPSSPGDRAAARL
jgi:hypothetical protein